MKLLSNSIFCCVALAAQVAALRSSNEAPEPASIELLIYETEDAASSAAGKLVAQANRLEGLHATVFGQGQQFEGFGSKFSAVRPMLKDMSPNQLVIITDSRDVLMNIPVSADTSLSKQAIEQFHFAFNELTHFNPGAIVVSAEAQCCVSALTHAAPGDYYNADGSRNERACSSGEENCLWKGDDKALPWETFMKDLAIQRTSDDFDDVYLNAGLIVGKASDLLRVIEQAAIGKDEDDQAVLTDFMYRKPDLVVLDYAQSLFGNNRGGLGDMSDSTCMFMLPEGEDENGPLKERLVHTKTGSTPLFLHSPGGFMQCHNDLAAKLGVETVSKPARRRLKSWNNGQGCNYRRLCSGLQNGIGNVEDRWGVDLEQEARDTIDNARDRVDRFEDRLERGSSWWN
jgi:hypothetical protein